MRPPTRTFNEHRGMKIHFRDAWFFLSLMPRKKKKKKKNHKYCIVFYIFAFDIGNLAAK
jgi:hypothetical protein